MAFCNKMHTREENYKPVNILGFQLCNLSTEFLFHRRHSNKLKLVKRKNSILAYLKINNKLNNCWFFFVVYIVVFFVFHIKTFLNFNIQKTTLTNENFYKTLDGFKGKLTSQIVLTNPLFSPMILNLPPLVPPLHNVNHSNQVRDHLYVFDIGSVNR